MTKITIEYKETEDFKPTTEWIIDCIGNMIVQQDKVNHVEAWKIISKAKLTVSK